MPKRLDISGKKFGRLKAISFQSVRGVHTYWNCICDCGKEVIVNTDHLVRGHTTSCGCYRLFQNTKHGLSHTKFMVAWQGIRYRCTNNKSKDYPQYGGRGIKCEWKFFKEFLHDMYGSFTEHVNKFGAKNTSIDRIDNDKGYSKKNCRWTTYKTQRLN